VSLADALHEPVDRSLERLAILEEGVMSLKRIPGFGKSGISRMRVARSLVVTAIGEG